MQLIYSGLYLTTNVIGPISYLIYAQLRSFAQIARTNQQLNSCLYQKKIQACNEQQKEQTDFYAKKDTKQFKQVAKISFGKWIVLILAIFVFNIFTLIFPRNIFIIFLGFAVKSAILFIPPQITQMVEDYIQKLHLEIYLQQVKSVAISYYFQWTQKLNLYLILNQIKQKDEQQLIVNQLKDHASRIQLELEQNEQMKNKSFIVKEKFIKSLIKFGTTLHNKKTFENVGVTCDILKPSQVGNKLLKILEQKTFLKQRSSIINGPNSLIQQPTPDHLLTESKSLPKQSKKSLNKPQNQNNLQSKMDKIKSSLNVPTNQRNTKKSQKQQKKQNFVTIKRSNTDIGDQLEFEDSQIKMKDSRTRRQFKQTNNPISHTEKQIDRNASSKPSQIGYELSNISQSQQAAIQNNLYSDRIQSHITSPLNVGMIDVVQSDNSQNKRSHIRPQNLGSFNRILSEEKQNNTEVNIKGSIIVRQEPSSPHVIPHGMTISSIQQNTIHPFKLNLSNLSNPLIPSGTLTRTNILPNSLYMSSTNKVISEQKKQSSLSGQQELQHITPQKQSLSYLSPINIEQQTIMPENFSQESSIPNKLEVSINESQYSDMFDSNGQQEEEPKLEIKVQAVVQNHRPNADKNLRPKLDICYIQLYDNKTIKFLNVYDKPTFEGKLVKMHKKPQNFYQLVLRLPKDSSEIQSKDIQPIQIVKNVKFRGQARPFMKYLQKL